MHMLDDHENDASSRCMIAMLVSDPEGYTKNSWFLLAKSEPQVNTIFSREKWIVGVLLTRTKIPARF